MNHSHTGMHHVKGFSRTTKSVFLFACLSLWMLGAQNLQQAPPSGPTPGSQTVAGFLTLAVMLSILPGWIAFTRRHKRRHIIVLSALAVSWTVIGWFFMMAWALGYVFKERVGTVHRVEPSMEGGPLAAVGSMNHHVQTEQTLRKPPYVLMGATALVITIVAVAWAIRFETTPVGSGAAYVTNRWTGETVFCHGPMCEPIQMPEPKLDFSKGGNPLDFSGGRTPLDMSGLTKIEPLDLTGFKPFVPNANDAPVFDLSGIEFEAEGSTETE